MHNRAAFASKNPDAPPPIRALVIMANLLDCHLVQVMLQSQDSLLFSPLITTADFDFGLSRCERLAPDVLIVDPKSAENCVSRTIGLVRIKTLERVILLDDRPREGLLAEILPYREISYLSREMHFSRLLSAIADCCLGTQRLIDPALAHRVNQTKHGWRFVPGSQVASVSALSTREKDILKLLALGKSSRDCANQLQLSVSTIDNHKARMMKKLDLHKVTELICLAFREGLVPV